VSAVYCSECGFQNPESANYCSRCGALLSKGESPAETTQTFSPEEIAEINRAALADLGPLESMRQGLREAVFAPGTSDEVLAMAEADISVVDERTASAIDAGMNATDVRPWISSISCRVLVATGEADVLAPVSEAEWFADQVGGRFVSMPGVGHLAMYDDPVRTADLITDNLRPESQHLSSPHKQSHGGME
jgi:pimeloyl-ACP methyl ester carboxylesterase